MTRYTAILLILLRLAIGWHFFAEGYHKLEGYWRGPTETVVGKFQPFSSAGYFREGTGPLAKLVRKEVGDPDEEALARLEPSPPSEGPNYKRTPPLLHNEWSAYVERFCDYFGLDEKQRAQADVKLKQVEEAVVSWLTSEQTDEKTKAIKKSFQSSTVEVKLPMPQRVAEYRAKLSDLHDTMNNRLFLLGHDVEGRRLIENKSDVVRTRTALLSDLDDYTKELQKNLDSLVTEEQKQQASQKDKKTEPTPEPGPMPNRMQKWLDLATMYGLAILGVCLLFGLFTRTTCVLSAGFLLMTYLIVPPWPWLPVPPNTEGYYAFVNKNLIEMLALLVLATTASGRWFGLDALVHAIFFGGRRRTV